jgi:hypothetical protein
VGDGVFDLPDTAFREIAVPLSLADVLRLGEHYTIDNHHYYYV